MTRMLPTHYAMLDVPETASPETIRAAYRAQRLACRAARNAGEADGARRRLLAIDEAYAVLSDPQRRRRHDAWIAYQATARAQAADPGAAGRRSSVLAQPAGARIAPGAHVRAAGWGRFGSSLLARLKIAS